MAKRLLTRIDELLLTRDELVRARWLRGAILNGDATEADRLELDAILREANTRRPVIDYSILPTEGKTPQQIESDRRALRRDERASWRRLKRWD